MSEFFTEKQTEDFLTSEVRALPLPEGGEQIVRGPKLMWLAMEDIIKEELQKKCWEITDLLFIL